VRPLLLFVLAACEHATSATPDAAADAPACDPTALALVPYDASLYVPIRYRDEQAYLLLDTGSSTTFLQVPLGSPDPTPHVGVVELACQTVTLDGRPEYPLPVVNGVPAVGQFGTDRMLAGPTEIDFATRWMRLHAHGQPFAEATAWPNTAFDLSHGQLLAHVALDGTPVRLIFDTGASDALWLGQPGKPGDVEIDIQDAQGAIHPAYRGTATLRLGSWSGTVSVLRVPSWPYLEETIKFLGGDIDGLLGISALGAGVVIDDNRILRANLH
jgi:hypothetical protein